jgi:hypothetical protein
MMRENSIRRDRAATTSALVLSGQSTAQGTLICFWNIRLGPGLQDLGEWQNTPCQHPDVFLMPVEAEFLRISQNGL